MGARLYLNTCVNSTTSSLENSAQHSTDFAAVNHVHDGSYALRSRARTAHEHEHEHMNMLNSCAVL